MHIQSLHSSPSTHEGLKILHYSLIGLLSPHTTIALNLHLGTLASMIYENDRIRLIGEQSFTHSELSLLLPLLNAFPTYCPYEVLLAHYVSDNHVTEAMVTKSRQRLYQVAEHGLWDQEMRPIRSALSHCRIKLRDLNLDVTSLQATGYLLSPCHKSLSKQKLSQDTTRAIAV